MGKRFLLQGGDCAESFEECEADIITRRLKVMLRMSLVLIYGSRLPVVRVGRFAGQYAKPRSSDTETRDGVSLPSYRGDMINGLPFTPEARMPDPTRLLQAHSRSAMTLNFVRALVDGGFADLHHPEYWDLGFMKHSANAKEYEDIVEAIGEAISFMETVHNAPTKSLHQAQFFTSHEALFLPYEEAHTRKVPHNEGWYNLSTHLPWIGMRTAFDESAHVEYMRGIVNPVGMKVGPALTPSDLAALVRHLNPDGEAGRLTLIQRFGKDKVGDLLPAMIQAVQATGIPVLWCCDPMHGNTISTENGYKTRPFEHIQDELEQAFDVHLSQGSRLQGVHFEMTGEDVTECTGGARGLEQADLSLAYKTQVDPRLNAEQAMEMALLIVKRLRNQAR